MTPIPNNTAEFISMPLAQKRMFIEQFKKNNTIRQAIALKIVPENYEAYLEQPEDKFITVHPLMQEMKRRAVVLSSRPECVLVTGESGTGKELVAQILHGTRVGNYAGANLAAIPDTLFESDLFGYVKGAFTGAQKDTPGMIMHCDNGTLFLDEVGDMPIVLQSKLLRVLQSKEYRPVGAQASRPVKCRFVFATHRNLLDMVDRGLFRRDLYFRISTFELHILPLRERPDDIVNIARHLGATDDMLKFIMDKHGGLLPGNVRELENLILKFQVFGLD